MKAWALSYLRCPLCRSPLENRVFEVNEAGETWSGALTCVNHQCRLWYPVIRGVPRMLPETLRMEMTRQFVHDHYSAIVAHGGWIAETSGVKTDALHSLKQHTIQNFGFEWTEYARFGWDDPVYNIQREEQVFCYKSLLGPEEIRDKLALDAGCGNGRYTYWAAQYGGQVIGVDLGDGVESASQNTAHLPNVQIVQGDIFNLPFGGDTFDIIFSIGVLMHTGDAHRATTHLIHVLRPGGSLTVHLYGRGNFIYEWVDRRLRQKTTRFSITDLKRFTGQLWRVTRFLERIRLLSAVTCFVRLDPHPHCLFDWYAAPIATHHTYPEVKDWFREAGMAVRQTNEPRRFRSRLRSLIAPTTVTVRGEKPA